jgi:formylglycine-generating enzyme
MHLGVPVRGDSSPLGGQEPRGQLCPSDMALVAERFCMDRYEASVVEIGPDGAERPHAATAPVTQLEVRAVSVPGVVPQAYISGREAKQACAASGKRLCREGELRGACRGAQRNQYPYGNEHQVNRCNDHGKSPRARLGLGASTWESMNSPRLNELPDTVAKTGDHPGCVSADGVYDLVGNLHEWTSDERGTFVGGYYLDAKSNGEGCDYRTTDHNFTYHDYSTGFRCCKDIELDDK